MAIRLLTATRFMRFGFILFLSASQLLGDAKKPRAKIAQEPKVIQTDLKTYYGSIRQEELREGMSKFNAAFASAADAYPNIFYDGNEFVPLFEIEYTWCKEHGDGTNNARAPVSKNACRDILITITNDREAYSRVSRASVQVEEFNLGKCMMENPDEYVTRGVPGRYFGKERVHKCVVEKEKFDAKIQFSIGDTELERLAWQERRRRAAIKKAISEKDRSDLPLFRPDGSLDVGVYECDPTNWKIVNMLLEVGLIRDIERPLDTGGGNIADWCNNDGNAIANSCAFEANPRNPMAPAPCKQAKSYWKFKVASIGYTPSICDTAVDKALNAAIRTGQKFRRFYDPLDQICKVRFERRRNAQLPPQLGHH